VGNNCGRTVHTSQPQPGDVAYTVCELPRGHEGDHEDWLGRRKARFSWETTCVDPAGPLVNACMPREGLRVTLEIHGREIVLMERLGGTLTDACPLVHALQLHYSSPVDEPAYFVAREVIRGFGWEPVGCTECHGFAWDVEQSVECPDCGGLGHTWQQLPVTVLERRATP
jgi:hypothetical protein